MKCLPTTALSKKCAQCEVEFKGMPSKLAKQKFCGQACAGANKAGKKKKEHISLDCRVCGKTIEVPPNRFQNGRRRYCSNPCRWRGRPPQKRLGIRHTDESRALMSMKAKKRYVREEASQWKGGRYTAKGYVHVLIATLPEASQKMAREMAPKKNYIQEHRIIMAMHLGRPITKDEVVHHINGVKTDNRPENLEALRRGDHTIHHREVEKEVARLRAENAALRAELESLKRIAA